VSFDTFFQISTSSALMCARRAKASTHWKYFIKMQKNPKPSDAILHRAKSISCQRSDVNGSTYRKIKNKAAPLSRRRSLM